MKKLLLYFALLSPLTGNVHAQAEPHQYSTAEVRTMSVEDRRKLFSSPLGHHLKNPNDFLGVLLLGMADTDQVTRRQAVAQVAMAMIGMQNIKRKGGQLPIDLSKMPEIQRELIKKLSDPDPKVRVVTVSALAYSGAPTTGNQDALLRLFSTENDPEVQSSIIEAMGFAGYDSGPYIHILFQSINSPDRQVKMTALRAISIIRPDGALPALVHALQTSDSERHLILEAISSYGDAAQPYLPVLHKLLDDPHAPAYISGDVKHAIAVIQSGKPENDVQGKVKAVNLQE